MKCPVFYNPHSFSCPVRIERSAHGNVGGDIINSSSIRYPLCFHSISRLSLY
jgi:hypothetical protein